MTFKNFAIKEELITEVKFDVNKLFQHYSKAFDITQKLTQYGRRNETTTEKVYMLVWSNGNNQWYVNRAYSPIKKGVTMELDADRILIPANTLAEAQLIAKFLPPLPLYAFSAEQNPLLKLDPNSSSGQVIGAIDDLKKQSPIRSKKEIYFDRLLDYYNQELSR